MYINETELSPKKTPDFYGQFIQQECQDNSMKRVVFPPNGARTKDTPMQKNETELQTICKNSFGGLGCGSSSRAPA
jgi:hypothetical protein